jgi:hypothetical protein
MTLPRLGALDRYWVKHPPIHLALLGWGDTSTPGEPSTKYDTAEDLMGLFPDGTIRG